ncbi:MAG TPA: LPS export ABC transporter periplasmic protein LptC [Hyphomicrobiaceae bacterium]|nr:LPS export ABC transporter periplasmic protein LptC [Hyphomicrobiaceae bacterium]
MAITFEMRGRDGPAGLGPASQALLDRARAFRSARRHSLLVRALRIGLPVLTLGASAAYLLALNSAWKIGPGRLSLGQVELTADDLTMKNPSYFGVTKDGGRYQVRAKRAVVEFNRQQAPIKLIDVDGDLVRSNNVTTKLKAKHGLLDNANSQLELYDGIEIDTSNGMAARLSRATITMKEHRVVSKEPVTASTPTGNVRSAGMSLKTDTQEASFQGNVIVRLVGSGGQGVGGFGRDARQPIEVNADRLDVNDASKTARFTGGVTATQGDSTLKSPELNVTYEGKAASAQLSGQPKSDEQTSRLSRLVAGKGAVITASGDRRVTSDEVDFDAKADTALFTGSVVVNQGRNVLNGRRMFVDRKAGKSRLDAPGDGAQPPGRITATFYQTETKAAQAKPKTAATEAVTAVQEQLFGSFKTDPNAPIDIEADSLDVNDPVRQAIFHTNVRAQQGEFVLRTVELVAFYSGQSGLGLGTGQQGDKAGDKAPAQLVRIEAKQKVLITSKDGQTATGDWANFDVKANTVLMGGRVVVTRGKDVAEGPRLKIDLTTGMYRFEVENEAPGAAAAVVSAPPPPADAAKASADTDPTKRACPAGKQCLLFYPKDTKDRAKEVGKKVLPNLPAKIGEGWQSNTSAGDPSRRGD